MIGVLRRAPQEDSSRFIAFDGTAFGEYLQTERIKEQILSDSFFHELRSFFQPKVSTKTGLCEGFEALARWKSPIFGNVSPGDFISLAEQGSRDRYGNEKKSCRPSRFPSTTLALEDSHR